MAGVSMRRAAAWCCAVLTACALVLASAPAAAMVIFVDPVAGLGQTEPTWDFTRLVLDVEPSESIENVMAKITDLDMDIVAERQQLFFGMQLLDPMFTLADYNIQKQAVLQLASTATSTAQGVPEPSSAWLLLLAGLGLAVWFRRKVRPA